MSCYAVTGDSNKTDHIGGSNCCTPVQCSASKKEPCTQLSPVECTQVDVLLDSPVPSSLCENQDEITDSAQSCEVQADHSVTSGFKEICNVSQY